MSAHEWPNRALQQGNPPAEVLLDLTWSYPDESTAETEDAGMSLHVDVIKNEWHAGQQALVARAFVKDGHFVVDSLDGRKEWVEIVSRPFIEPQTGETLDPEKDSEAFLSKLNEAMHGSYLVATEAHEEEDCEYQSVVSIPVRGVEHAGAKRVPFWRRKLLRHQG